MRILDYLNLNLLNHIKFALIYLRIYFDKSENSLYIKSMYFRCEVVILISFEFSSIINAFYKNKQ